MITRRSSREIECMRQAGVIVAEVLSLCAKLAKPGISTEEIDSEAEKHIKKRGGIALFKGYRSFPKTLCTSFNEEVVHGIPGPRRVEKGDMLSIDVGVRLGGYCADAAVTLGIEDVSSDVQRVIDVCRNALYRAIAVLRPGMRLSEISRAIQTYVELQGCSVVRSYTGHGIGRDMHEEPQVPNFVAKAMADPVLYEGTVLAIEPMVNLGGYEVEVLANGWTVVTKDKTLSAHFEHTVAIHDDGPDILTRGKE